MEDWIYVTRTAMPPLKNHIRDLYDLWDQRHLTTQGEKQEELQRTLASELGVSHVTLTANGHIALELALKALECTGEVITSPFTFASTTQAIINSGCTPVFCDINQSTWTIDASKIEQLITPKTSAIFAVHVFGHVCDVVQIEAIAKKYNLKVIYDASHAYKVKVSDEHVSKFGNCTIFNLHASKLFHATKGVALATNDAALAKQFETQRVYALVDDEKIVQGKNNTKMSEFHAAMGLCNINYVDSWIVKRKELYAHYVLQLKDIAGIIIPKLQPNVQHNYSYFPILIEKDRQGLIPYLKVHRIIARKYFSPLTSSILALDRFGLGNTIKEKSSTPIAEWIADRVLCLPLYADLSLEQVDKICAYVKEYIQLASVRIGEAPSDVVKKELTTI